MNSIKDQEVRICEATGDRVVMEYVGKDFVENNGNPGWLCLHQNKDAPSEEEQARLDEEAVKQFLLDQENR